MTGKTLYDKLWDAHLVHEAEDGTCLLYIDRHLVHEVTSPQAFEGLRMAGRTVRAPEKTLAVVDHNVPTTDRSLGIDDPESKIQIEALAKNALDFGIDYYHERDKRQGIVHVVGPEQGFTLPGTTIVCGDSHTSTHGAFGALAHGIGTSEVPIPCANAPKAPCVAVWLSPQTTVMPGSVQPCSGPTIWTIPCRTSLTG